MVVRVEYDRSNRVCIRRTGTRPSYAVTQGDQAFWPPAGTGAAKPTSAALDYGATRSIGACLLCLDIS